MWFFECPKVPVSEHLFEFKVLTGPKYSWNLQVGEFCRKKSNAIMLKTKNILKNFYCIFEIYIKFWALWKKDELHSLNISQTSDSE